MIAQIVKIQASTGQVLGKLADSSKVLSDAEAQRRRDAEDAKFHKREDLIVIKAVDADSFMMELLEHEGQMNRMGVKGAKNLFTRFMEALRSGNQGLS